MHAQQLPNELWLRIIGECMARTRMRLEQTCTRMHSLVRDYEWRVSTMDVQREFNFGDFVAFSQVLDYLRDRCALVHLGRPNLMHTDTANCRI